jgi:peroxiredoxin
MTGIKPADKFPAIGFSLVGGGTRKVQDWAGRWVMLIVYRGNHCPRCKSYVAKLHALAPAYAGRGVELLLASADPEDMAQRTIDENGWTLPVAYGLTEAQSRQLSLYVSEHEAGYELTGTYAESGLFLINPDGLIQSMERSNSPSIRPDLEVVLDGIIGTQERNLPIRGLA